MFRDSRRPTGFLYGFLDYRLIDVVAALDAGIAVKYLLLAGNTNCQPH